ncbi:YciI family protein [Kluyvera sp. STS39-E]|uniref:YciI family protein n=1 Tax=Kluyvera sp. STS39-E TaxID=3234748 RepID=UPI0034C5D7B5
MYLINIEVNKDISPEQHDALFAQHVSWFQRYFDAGKFVLIGPYADRERAGVIIARTESREELDAILKEDVYFPNSAKYEIREFIPKMLGNWQ